jgi:hypothetical protein
MSKKEENVLEKYRAEYEKLKVLYDHIYQVLNDWLYGIQMVAIDDGEKLYRRIEKIGVTHWIKHTLGLNLKKVDSPLKAIETYIDIADKEGLMKRDQCHLEKNGEKIKVTISGSCIYQKVCGDILKEGFTPLCGRTIPFLVAIELTMGEEVAEKYRCEAVEINPGKKCEIEIMPVWWLSTESNKEYIKNSG